MTKKKIEKEEILEEQLQEEIQEQVVDEFLASELEAGLDIEVPAEEDDGNTGGIGADSNYNPRLTIPTKSNKYYMTTKYGGVNECILGSPQYTTGSALANCVGYAWGRAYELLGKRPTLSRGNAENWWGHTSDGYKRGQTPKLGAIVCWRKGQAGVSSDGAGHVAVVEAIDEKAKTIKVSNSGYGSSTVFWLTTYTMGKYSHGAYTFQGFIYIGEWDPPYKKYINVDGVWGKSTTEYTQKLLGTTIDGIVSKQPRGNKKYLPGASTASWKFVLIGAKGSAMIKALQTLIGAGVDGKMGKKSVTALQNFLIRKKLYTGSVDGVMGAGTVKAWQTYVNDYFNGRG